MWWALGLRRVRGTCGEGGVITAVRTWVDGATGWQCAIIRQTKLSGIKVATAYVEVPKHRTVHGAGHDLQFFKGLSLTYSGNLPALGAAEDSWWFGIDDAYGVDTDEELIVRITHVAIEIDGAVS